MWRVELHCEEGTEEIALARFMAYEIAAADSETPGLARVWFAAHDEALRCIADLNGSTIHEEPKDNWNADWQQSEWRATAVGEKLWLAPPWDDAPAPAGRIRLDMHPGTLFGNGDHSTTQLCLEALERHVSPAATVADIGCGSGLISQAALLLGARRAIGCDLDPEAARAVTAGSAFQGSVDALATGSVDILIANIQLGVLDTLLPEMRRVLRPGGVAILSGVLEEQVDSLAVERREVRLKSGWACVESTLGGS